MENLTLEKLQELKQAEKTVYLFTTTWCVTVTTSNRLCLK